ncbi:right-handed parallel beta-helix repeat-containing protein, partial [Deinococcus sp. MIMF12]
PLAQSASRRGRVDVKSFGARGDGRADDTAALNRAAAGAAGRDLVFSAGTYLIRGPVVFTGYRGQTVLAEGGATIQAARDYRHGSADGMLHFQQPRDVTVRDLKIVGNRDPEANPYAVFIDGLRIAGGKDITVSGLTVVNAPTNGIAVVDSDTVTLRGNTMQSAGGAGGWSQRTVHQRWLNNTVIGFGDPAGRLKAGLGLFATIGDDFLAEGNVIRNVANTATKTEGVSNVVYRGNTVDVFGKDGIKVMPYPGHSTSVRNAVIENNTVRAWRAWASDGSSYILLHAVIGGRVRGNRIEGTGGTPEVYGEDAIKVNAWGGTASRDILIENNEARNTRRGLRIEADGVTVRGNTITGTLPWTRSGVIVAGHGVTVADNLIAGAAVGVLIDRGMNRTRIENNRFDRVETAVYADNGNADVTVSRNRFGPEVQKAIAGSVRGGCNFYNSAQCGPR